MQAYVDPVIAGHWRAAALRLVGHRVCCREERDLRVVLVFFFLNDPAPPDISPLPLPDPLPIPVLGRLCARLVAASLAVDALDARLELASGGHHARAVALAVPMCEVKPMLALLTLDLEAHPPAARDRKSTRLNSSH